MEPWTPDSSYFRGLQRTPVYPLSTTMAASQHRFQAGVPALRIWEFGLRELLGFRCSHVGRLEGLCFEGPGVYQSLRVSRALWVCRSGGLR